MTDWFDANGTAADSTGDDWFEQNGTAIDSGGGAPADVSRTGQSPGGDRIGLRRWIAPALPYAAGAAATALVPGGPGLGLGRAALARLLAAYGGGAAGEMAGAGLQGETADPGRVVGAGATQAALQLPAEGVGALASGLGRLSAGNRSRAVESGVRGLRKAYDTTLQRMRESGPDRLAVAGETTKKIRAAGELATTERKAAGAETAREISAASGKRGSEISVAEIAEPLIEHRARLRGKPLTPKERLAAVMEVRERLASVLPEQTLGAIKGNKLVFSLEEGQLAKQAFDQSSRTAHDQAARGVKPNADLDVLISNSWRRAVEKRVPKVGALNARTQAALGEERPLKSLAKGRATPTIEALREQERIARREASAPSDAVLRSMVENRLDNRVEGPMFNVGLHGITLPTPRDLSGKSARVLGSPAARRTAAAGPRLLALLAELLGGGNSPVIPEAEVVP